MAPILSDPRPWSENPHTVRVSKVLRWGSRNRLHGSVWRRRQQTAPTLVIHGEADSIVPIEGSDQRTHRAVLHSKPVRVNGAPHGLNVSHEQAFTDALLSFLRA